MTDPTLHPADLDRLAETSEWAHRLALRLVGNSHLPEGGALGADLTALQRLDPMVERRTFRADLESADVVRRDRALCGPAPGQRQLSMSTSATTPAASKRTAST